MRKLIDALRSAANKVEKNKTIYNWNQRQTCNCGVVAQEITNISITDLTDQMLMITHLGRTWTELSSLNTCSVTGSSIQDILSKLDAAGLKRSDFTELEYLSNPDILKLANINTFQPQYYENRDNFVKYARAWADMLEEKESQDLIKDVKELVHKSVPQTPNLPKPNARKSCRKKQYNQIYQV